MASNEYVQKYYDSLIASYDLLVDAVAKANDRGIKVTKQFATDVAKGQREALELGRKLAAEPSDLGQFYTAVLEATTAAQGRALAFTQTAYSEALGASGEARETVEKLVKANQDTAKAAVEVARTWTTANPMVDMVKKGYAAMQPAAKTAKKEKAAV
jgi:bisphosphoglycerate-dependent phosphoglycerate mutase